MGKNVTTEVGEQGTTFIECNIRVLEKNHHLLRTLRSGGEKLLKPQPNLNPTVGFYAKMTLQPPPTTTTTQTQCQQYISCY